MRKMNLKAKTGDCEIILGESVANLGSYCPLGKTVIVTDANVRRLHGSLFPKAEVIEIGEGEDAKTLGTVESLYERFIELGLDRDSFVIGIGGGMVCDVAGFAASTYLRGLGFGFVPTTLLAQADAGIGGKNGVNFKGFKNLVGTFRQPAFCLMDFDLLKTLPERELRNGFAEIVKHGAIGDAALFSYLEENHAQALSLKRPVIEKVVLDSLVVKAGIVGGDELEKGERTKLNFGHTVGHALEAVAGLPHGEAVSIGMVAEARLSVSKGTLQKKDADRIAALLEKIGLPAKIKCDKGRLMEAMAKDKKRHDSGVNAVLLEGIGKSSVARVGFDELKGVLDDLR